MKRLNANYGGKQVNETGCALNSVPDDFDITTCKNLDDLYQVTMTTMKGKKKARKNTANYASSRSNADDWGNLTEDSTEPEIKNLVDETQTPKSSNGVYQRKRIHPFLSRNRQFAPWKLMLLK